MQRRLLPDQLSDVSGLETAARYLPAAGSSLGGDWYDVFSLPGGRVAVAVGDVVGRGVEAAAVMAQLRTAVRAYAADGHPPAAVLERVNTLMWHLGPLAMTTALYAVLDPAAETLELVSAGHPPALVIPPSGAAAYLEPQPGAAPRGEPDVHLRVTDFRLPTGAILLLYTDGLVERRGESIDFGLERLRVLGEGIGDVEALCASVVERLVGEEPSDDVAFVAVRVPPLTDHLTTRWPATADSLAAIRYLLRRWLGSRGAGDEETYDIVVACQEACANAVEHAYGPGPRRARARARRVYADGRVSVTISDRGRWRPSRSENRGRGLPMMRALMDTVEVRRRDDGTDVVLAGASGRRRRDAARPHHRRAPWRPRGRARRGRDRCLQREVGREQAAGVAHQPVRRAGRGPVRDDVPRQRRDRAVVRARRGPPTAPAAAAPRGRRRNPRSPAW